MGSSFPFFVGNDLIDRSETDFSENAGNPRYLRKVLSPVERGLMESFAESARPEKLLRLWAAKEAAFKAFSKAAAGKGIRYAFAPSRIEISEDHAEARCLNTGMSAWLHFEDDSDHLHCIAVCGEEPPLDIRFKVERSLRQGPLRETETAGGRLRPSASARMLAVELLAREEGPSPMVVRDLDERGLPGPPRFEDPFGGGIRADLSLSHDGPFIAAVVARVNPLRK